MMEGKATAAQHLALYDADGREVARTLITHWYYPAIRPTIEVTLDAGVYFVELILHRSEGRPYRLVFEGGLVSMAAFPSQDALGSQLLSELAVDDVQLDPLADFRQLEVTADTTQVTVDAVAMNAADRVVVLPRDADSMESGHQVELIGSGPNYVTVTVIGSDGLPKSTQVVSVTKAGSG